MGCLRAGHAPQGSGFGRRDAGSVGVLPQPGPACGTRRKALGIPWVPLRLEGWCRLLLGPRLLQEEAHLAGFSLAAGQPRCRGVSVEMQRLLGNARSPALGRALSTLTP